MDEDVLKIESDGNIWPGITRPSEKLHINANSECGWGDPHPERNLDIYGDVKVWRGTCIPQSKLHLRVIDREYVTEDILQWANGNINLAPEEMKAVIQYLSMALRETFLKDEIQP